MSKPYCTIRAGDTVRAQFATTITVYMKKIEKKWVSITEQLPEMGVDVLLFDDWKTSDGNQHIQEMKVGYLSEFTTRKTANGIAVSCEWRGHDVFINITHWMPLPLAPK